eukprot:3399740-Amphidinium_carterae.1
MALQQMQPPVQHGSPVRTSCMNEWEYKQKRYPNEGCPESSPVEVFGKPVRIKFNEPDEQQDRD